MTYPGEFIGIAKNVNDYPGTNAEGYDNTNHVDPLKPTIYPKQKNGKPLI